MRQTNRQRSLSTNGNKITGTFAGADNNCWLYENIQAKGISGNLDVNNTSVKVDQQINKVSATSSIL